MCAFDFLFADGAQHGLQQVKTYHDSQVAAHCPSLWKCETFLLSADRHSAQRIQGLSRARQQAACLSVHFDCCTFPSGCKSAWHFLHVRTPEDLRCRPGIVSAAANVHDCCTLTWLVQLWLCPIQVPSFRRRSAHSPLDKVLESPAERLPIYTVHTEFQCSYCTPSQAFTDEVAWKQTALVYLHWMFGSLLDD